MARNVDLWNHLPPFLQNFREMCELVSTENPEFALAAQETDSIVDEMFIQTATNVGLKRYEKILGISPGKGDSRESRRSAIMARWNDVIPYTMSTLKNKIIAIQGNDNVEIILSTNRPYEIEIITNLENPGQVNDLAYILQTMIPCNLVVHSVNIIKGETQTGMGCGVGATVVDNVFLTDDFHSDHNLSLPVGIAGGQSATRVLFLTDSMNENVDVNGFTAVGTSGSFTNVIEIN